MLTKLLVTAVVIVVVALVFRNQRVPEVARRETQRDTDAGIKTQTVAYVIVAIIVAVGALLWFLDWRESHRIINIEVTAAGGAPVVRYQAYQKDIKGKEFVTLDGRTVSVGDSERIEMIAR